MDFSFSDEQAMLIDSVDRFVADGQDFEQAQAKASMPDGFDRADWARFAELGWLMLRIPEERGGLGFGTADAAMLMEAFGRGLVTAPYLSTAIVAARLLADADADASDAQAPLLAAIGEGRAIVAVATEEARSRYELGAVAATAISIGDGYRLDGTKIAVPDGPAADYFLVSALEQGRLALFRVEAGAPGLTTRAYRTIDRRKACDLSFDETPAQRVIADADAPLARAIDEASLLLAAEGLGCMEAAMAMTADYLKTRQQFGRALSQFQVLTHRMADMFVRTENARSMVLRGLSAIETPSAQRSAAVSATMIALIEAAEFVCGQAIQLHGGIGMAEENAVGHYYKRIRAIGRTYGDLNYHRKRHLELIRRRDS